ncbi:MAG: hypothetical protein ACHQ9S_02685 [Candidatus Binatia bacterium]
MAKLRLMADPSQSSTGDAAPPPPSPAERLAGALRRFAADNWKVVLYVLLIVLCVLFAPEEPLKFIYTEF